MLICANTIRSTQSSIKQYLMSDMFELFLVVAEHGIPVNKREHDSRNIINWNRTDYVRILQIFEKQCSVF